MILKKEKPSTVVVALSGGVDSSLAAALLKESGWRVTGLHFRLPGPTRTQDQKHRLVQRTAAHLEIPVSYPDLIPRFGRRIVRPFVEDYLAGRTPNPCILCNREIKFQHLLEFAREQGIDRIATGHYVILCETESGDPALCRGKDRRKEQSYFLHRLTPPHLTRALFPLGRMTKIEARNLAEDLGLPTSEEPESQEVCFIPDNDYRSFLEEQAGLGIVKKGDITDRKGRKVGEHSGVYRYTIGQRHGLGIASPRPYYVMALHPEDNRVIVGRKEDLFTSRVRAEDFNWTDGRVPEQDLTVEAQIRYRHRPAPGRLEILSPRRVRMTFATPQWAVTPGQALVCYDRERVLGGGWITETY